MANYNNLISAIQSVIKTNGNNEITGQLLQTELVSMITTLGAGYQYVGVAQPSTNPGTPDARVMYLAYMPGTYTNFGGIEVTGFCVLRYDTSWVKEEIPISGGGGGGGGTDFLTEPDDLTLVPSGDTNILKFANRNYNSANPNGLGYKILRGDHTFAEQVTAANTIYEIRYKFDLGAATINIPNGCILYFKGGSLTRGNIVADGLEIWGEVGIFGSALTLTITNYPGVVMANWFGTTTYSIQRAIHAFPDAPISLNGTWTFDGKVVVPYDTTLVCDSGSVEVTSAESLFDLYLSRNEMHLENFKVFLTSSFTGKLINVYGVDASHSTIRGYKSTIEANLQAAEIHFPQIYGVRTAGVTCIELTGTDLFYFKKFYSYAYNCETQLRCQGKSGLNSCEFFIDSWFCVNGVSLSSGFSNKSIKFHIKYQAYSGSNRVLKIDDFSSATNDEGVYYISLWDPTSGSTYIDNSTEATFIDELTSLPSLSQYFANKTAFSASYTHDNWTEKPFTFKQGIPLKIQSVYAIANLIIGNASTRVAATNNLITYFKRLGIQHTFEVDLMTGTFYYIDATIQTKLKRLFLNDSEDSPVNLSNSCRIFIRFPLSADTSPKYYRYFIDVYDYTNNKHLCKVSSLTYTDGAVTAISDLITHVSPINANGVTTTGRPTLGSNGKGFCVFDTTLNKPVWWTGTAWVDATGTGV